MITVTDKKLFVGTKSLPKGDVAILKIILEHGPVSVHKISEFKGEIYDQYISSRLRFLTSAILSNIVIKVDRGMYEINPEIREELQDALNKLGG